MDNTNKATEDIKKTIEEVETDENDSDGKTSMDSAESSDNNTKSTKRGASIPTDVMSGWQEKKTTESESEMPHPSEITNIGNTADQSTSTEPKSESAYNISDVHIVTDDFLRRLIAYGEYVKVKEEIYRNMPVENRKRNKIELVIAKQPDKKLVGIKFNYETIPQALNNEFEYAQYEELKAETILSLKTQVEKGSYQPEDKPHMFITNLNFDLDDVIDAVEYDLIKYEAEKESWNKTECELIYIDAGVKNCLATDRADPRQALKYLDNMLYLPIEPLMLKKLPHIIDLVNRVRTYIGNVNEWNLTGSQLRAFELEAEKLRNKAEEVYFRLIDIFGAENETDFWRTFPNSVQTFVEQTKDLCGNYIYSLTAEPLSRIAFIDALKQAEEMTLLISQIEDDVQQIRVVEDHDPVA